MVVSIFHIKNHKTTKQNFSFLLMLFKIRLLNEILMGAEWVLKTKVYVSTNIIRDIMDFSGKKVIFFGDELKEFTEDSL